MNRRYFIIGSVAALACAGCYGWQLWKRFGSLPQLPPDSPNWRNGAFRNLPDNYVNANLDNEALHEGGWLKFLFARNDGRYPPGRVPAIKEELASLHDGEFIWLGHSSFLLKLAGKTICVDPVLSGRASPIPFTIQAWHGSMPWHIKDFPFIDYLCITHDHWDHLDYEAVSKLQYGLALCGKGVGAHFAAWTLQPPRELDWGEECLEGHLKFVFTPSRHFSGRGFRRNQSLWGGFIVSAGCGGSVYFTGDGGYGRHFAVIGNKYGPFDIIFPDTGQYNRGWPDVHMFPEESVRACLESRARLACPCHIGKFTLAWHPWDEPMRRFGAAAQSCGLSFITPVIGKKYSIRGPLST